MELISAPSHPQHIPGNLAGVQMLRTHSVGKKKRETEWNWLPNCLLSFSAVSEYKRSWFPCSLCILPLSWNPQDFLHIRSHHLPTEVILLLPFPLVPLVSVWPCRENVVVFSRSGVSDSLNPMGCSPPGSSVHGNTPGKNTGVGCYVLLQGIFPTQRLNLRSPALQADSLPAEPPGKPNAFWVYYKIVYVKV